MTTLALVFAALAAALHVLFFVMESLLFDRPAVQKRFGVVGPAAAEAVRPWALNQGFYNLFLALGCGLGIALALAGERAGCAVIVVTCGVMLGAAVVLWVSDARMRRAAIIQGLPPALAIALLVATF